MVKVWLRVETTVISNTCRHPTGWCHFPRSGEHYSRWYGRITGQTLAWSKVNLIRYADDFVVTGKDEETLEKARNLIQEFLKERGLTLSPEKTKIVHIEEGFDFLGWNIRK